MNMPAKTKWLEEAKDHLIYYKIVLWWLMVFAPNKIHFSLFDRVVKARVQYMFGHLEMVVQMMIVTVMVMQPVCGQSPSILQQMMVRRLAMTSPVLPHSHPHSVMERVDTKTLEWSVYLTLESYFETRIFVTKLYTHYWCTVIGTHNWSRHMILPH